MKSLFHLTGLHLDGEKHVLGLQWVHPFAFSVELVESPHGVSLKDLEGEEPADVLGLVPGVKSRMPSWRCTPSAATARGPPSLQPLGEPGAELQQITNVAAGIPAGRDSSWSGRYQSEAGGESCSHRASSCSACRA
jgi:hypothetical protein